ncbi:hypothetical protein [Desulfobacula phenolica]|uniref:Sulfotransferase domain-containing protein n=1 Tax=Desulfobacula phenolica TaxID=90732 RepID=A0A1H2DRH0_9BACT|nr:hypothetical protein [Desulfobacula phenolica]SDT85497.1 hypothetical protein SAMN04487931_10230 [Desulfobacula phenolica]
MKIPPFYISSRGHSATTWLTTSLSKHPEIVCFHGTRSIPPKSSGTVPDMSPEQFIDGLITCSESSHGKVFGAAHGFYGISCKKAVEERGGKFTAIIRQPIKRIHSCFIHAHKKEIIPKDHEDYNNATSIGIYKYISDHNLDKVKSRRNKQGELMISGVENIFYHYCKSFIYFDLICIQEAGKEFNFKMEDLVTSKQEFERLFRYITQDKIKCDQSYIDSVNLKEKINTHTKNEPPEDIYNSWPASFKYLFHKAVMDNGMDSVYRTYEDMGYTVPEKSLNDFTINNMSINDL